MKVFQVIKYLNMQYSTIANKVHKCICVNANSKIRDYKKGSRDYILDYRLILYRFDSCKENIIFNL